jgi:uncharacterized protein YdeI (YjbR/CyaY-like superfamily)
MGRTDRRVDAYILRSAEFARPILRYVRGVVHDGCPEVEETIKWGFPHFVHHGILCSMASFKAHCALTFWKGKVLAERVPGMPGATGEAMGQFGRLTAIRDLPSRTVLLRLVREASRLNEGGIKAPARPRPATKAVRAPADLLAALRNSPEARAGWDSLTPGQKREYIEWITEAKRDETRRRRLATAVEWMAEGRIRNWKYVR